MARRSGAIRQYLKALCDCAKPVLQYGTLSTLFAESTLAAVGVELNDETPPVSLTTAISPLFSHDSQGGLSPVRSAIVNRHLTTI